MVELFANSGDPDQTPRSAASDLGRVLRRLIWVCTVCQLPFYGLSDNNGLISLHI